MIDDLHRLTRADMIRYLELQLTISLLGSGLESFRASLEPFTSITSLNLGCYEFNVLKAAIGIGNSGPVLPKLRTLSLRLWFQRRANGPLSTCEKFVEWWDLFIDVLHQRRNAGAPLHQLELFGGWYNENDVQLVDVDKAAVERVRTLVGEFYDTRTSARYPMIG